MKSLKKLADLADKFEKKLNKLGQKDISVDSTEGGVHFGILFDTNDAKKTAFTNALSAAFAKAPPVDVSTGSDGKDVESGSYEVKNIYFDISVGTTPDSGKIVPHAEAVITAGKPTSSGKPITAAALQAFALNAMRGAYKIAMGVTPEGRAEQLNKAKKFPLNANKSVPELTFNGFGS
jgi:hypothetical protein